MLYNNVTNCSRRCPKKTLFLSEKEARNTVLKWYDTVVNTNGKYSTTEEIASAINSFFDKNGVLRGTISRLIRTKTGAIENLLDASGGGVLNDETRPNAYTIKNYFLVFNGLASPGLAAEYNEDNNYLVRYAKNLVQYNIYMKFNIGVIAVMTFVLRKNPNGNIKIMSLHSSPIFNDPTSFNPNEPQVQE